MRNATHAHDWAKFWNNFDYDLYLRILRVKDYAYDRNREIPKRNSRVESSTNRGTVC